MRRLPAATVVSVVVHGAIVAWFARDEPAVVVVAPPAPAPVAAPAPIEVELLAPPAILAVPELDPITLTRKPGATTARITTRTGREAAPERENIAPPAAGDRERRTTLAMRDPWERTLGISQGFVDDFLGDSKPLPPVPDLPGARIDAEIKDLRARLKDPSYTSRASPDQLTADRIALGQLTGAREHVELRANKDGSYGADKTTYVAQVDPDGKVHLEDKANLQREGLGARFDVTDWAMRSQGIDPYAAEKLRFLDRTRDQRVAIGKQHRTAQLARSAALMQRNIDRLWARTTDLDARKRGLFELWDDCAERGSAELVAGGTAARALVVSFIQVKLRGADAYTGPELARLNARRQSEAVFAPYD